MTALRIGIHEHRGGGIFEHARSGFTAGLFKSLLGILHYKFLAKGVYKVLCPTGDDNLIWVLACETHCITYHITPQTG